MPELPAEIVYSDLDREVRAELSSLPKGKAERVGRHLVAAGELLAEDPELAWAHAAAARSLAPRIGVVREAAGLAAYRAGQWQTAVGEIRTYHRITGRQPHLAVLADCERALGRPERALELYRDGSDAELTREERMELLIVAAGARVDLGQPETAVRMLRLPELDRDEPAPLVARLRYAYADALLAAERRDEAQEWFARAVAVDEDAATDAAERLLELQGVTLHEDEEGAGSGAGVEDRVTTPAHTASPALTVVDEETQAQPLAHVFDLIILDLDGVVLLGEQAIPAAVTALAELREAGRAVAFATNNASRRPAEVAALLTRVGIPAEPEEVLTAAMVAADTLAQRLPDGAPVLVVGSDALTTEVRRVGLRPVTAAEEQPAAVVQGFGPEVSWADLAEATVAIRAGALWVATNTDATLPSPRGPVPGNGSLVAALGTALGRGPDVAGGKPEPDFFSVAAQRFDVRRPLVVGDRLETDIEGANRAGLASLLVLTGVADREQAEAAPAERRPTFIGEDLTAVLRPGRRLSPELP